MTAKTITLNPPMEGTGKVTIRAARDAQQSILLDFLEGWPRKSGQ